MKNDVLKFAVAAAFLFLVATIVAAQDRTAINLTMLAATVSVQDLSIPLQAQKEFQKGRKLLLEQHRIADSIAFFDKAIRLAPSYSQAYFLLGGAYMGMERWADAEKSLLHSVSLNTNVSAATLALGSCMVEEGKFEEAEEYLRDGLRSNPKYTGGYYDLGRSYYGLRRFDEAAAEARTVVRLAPESPNAHALLGYVLLKLNDANGAFGEFQEYLQLAPAGELSTRIRSAVSVLKTELAAH